SSILLDGSTTSWPTIHGGRISWWALMDVAEIRTLYTHLAWADETLLTLAEQLPPARTRERVLAGAGSIAATLAHTIGVQRLRLIRWQGGGWVDLPPPDEVDLAMVRALVPD